MPGTWTILVTGGAGFVGVHTVIPLLEANFKVIIIDNLHNAYKDPNGKKPEALLRVEQMTGKQTLFYDVDLQDVKALSHVFESHNIDCVLHFAALKAVGESCIIPLMYYKNNVGGSCNLFDVMKQYGVYRIVYSSSATVYGTPQFLPMTEEHPTGQGCTNPYGKSKYFVEEILQDLCKSDGNWSVISLRYFNPVGAHPSGLIGEDPKGWPNNLFPFISQVAVGRRDQLLVYGNDYNTSDGTGSRDYIHIMDLAEGHVNALQKLQEPNFTGFKAYNLGTGTGLTVLQVLKAFQEASGRKINYKIVERRPGDIDASYADPSLAAKELKWVATRTLDDICRDMWKWQSQNPQGFTSE